MSNITLKILLIGDSTVGKTTLLLQYVDGKFSDSHITTIGVEYKDKNINLDGRELTLQIWDTSGQERYQSITKNFYRNADGIIFIFDLTNKESFEHMKNWLMSSVDCNKDFKSILVGNKLDLKNERVVNEESIKKFLEKNEMKFFETSAKEGTNVDIIFKEISQLILAGKTNEEIIEEFGSKKRSSSVLSKDTSLEDKKETKKKCC
jgi:small GTP-binding protein